MSKQVYQYRFGTNSDNVLVEENGLINNILDDESGVILPDGTILHNVEQISIETIPGIICYINDVKTRIGLTGIYEVNFKDNVINKLYFDKASIELIEHRAELDRMNDHRNTKTLLLINVVYNE